MLSDHKKQHYSFALKNGSINAAIDLYHHFIQRVLNQLSYTAITAIQNHSADCVTL